jgi:ATP-dependent Clp protease ATP-binding subunit ClpC
VGDLLAGTGVRGALAERLTALRKEVAALDGEVVLFLDDVHALLAATGAGEGAQELRAAMASGDFPCIVTTSPEGYRRYIEPDQALERRMTRVEIDEPSLEDTRHIMASGVGHYREHHGVDFADDALEAALQLSQRYLTDRRQPDKVFGVLDLAGSRAQRRKVSEVSRATVAEVVADLSGVPLERLAATDAERLLGLEELLGRRVIGHHHNLAQIAGALRRNAAGLGGERPVGSFLLLGPTGVGKTETARALAEVLFPGGGGMSRFDMSELSESHSVARLVGAPPGYVGYEAGGHLTEALRARPYQVVLLDEIEKAHPKVHMLLLQILEEGRLTDGRGRTVDFRHAVIIMTSNLGVSAVGAAKPIGFAAQKDATPTAGTATVEAARASVPPELWNRFDEVLYYAALSAEEVAEVARLMLQATAQRLEREKGILLDFDPSVVELLLNCGGYDPTLGARPMRRAVQRLVEAPLAEAVLRGEAGPQDRWRLVVRQGRVEAVVAGEASS